MSNRRQFHCCLRCGYRWIGRYAFKGDSGLPKRCAGCRSPLWDTPRRNVPGQGRKPDHCQISPWMLAPRGRNEQLTQPG